LNQGKLADLLGSSRRTVQRWETASSYPQPHYLHALADAVRPHDAALAEALDGHAPRPVAPPPPPPPPAIVPVADAVSAAEAPPTIPPRAVLAVPAHVLVDSVVCAAAEAMSLAPQALRPALVAAFRRAREAGLTPQDMLTVLAPGDEDSAG
jgi:hypothetical protein